MKKRKHIIAAFCLLLACFLMPLGVLAAESPANTALSIIRDLPQEVQTYINQQDWITEITNAKSTHPEERANYSIEKSRTVEMYNLGNGYASQWKNQNDNIFTNDKKIWAFPYLYANQIDGAVVVFNTTPYTYSIVLDNSNRCLQLLFDDQLLAKTLEKNRINTVYDFKAVFGTMSAAPSVLYMNHSVILPVDEKKIDDIKAVNWEEFIEKQSFAEVPVEDDRVGGGGIQAVDDTIKIKQPVGRNAGQIGLVVFLISISGGGLLVILRVKKKRRLTKITTSLAMVAVMGINIIAVGIVPVKAADTISQPSETATLQQVPENITSLIQDELESEQKLAPNMNDDLNSITVENEDGTLTTYGFQEPIKFKDSNNKVKYKNDKLKTCGLLSNYAYENTENNIKSYLPKKIKNGVKLTGPEFELTFTPVTNANAKAQKTDVRYHDIEEEVIEYKDVFGADTRLQYKPILNGIKENIVLDHYHGKSTFQFYVDIGDLVPAYFEGESIPLLNPKTKDITTVLGQVDARDSYVGENEENNIHFTLFNSLKLTKQTDEKYLLTIQVDKEFLESPTTVYPVVIDPIAYTTTSMKDTTIYSEKYNQQTFYTSSYNNVGDHGSYGQGQALIKITNISYFKNSNIIPENLIDVTYHVYEGSGRTSESIIQLREAYGKWQDNTVTFANRPDYSDFVSDMRINSSGWKDFSMTYLFKKWLKYARGEGGTSADNGFYLKAYYADGASDSRHFCSTEHSTYKPYVKVHYQAGTLETGVYYIKNKQSGKYIDVNGQYTSSSTNVHQWQLHGAQSQQWRVISAGSGYYYLKPMHASSMALDVYNAGTANGTNVWQYTSNNSDAQKWKIQENSYSDGTYRILSKVAGEKALAVYQATSNNGANIVVWDYSYLGDRNDDWIFERADVEVTVPLIPQDKDQWCWAASAEMSARRWNIAYTRQQWDAVSYVKGSPINEPGTIRESELVAEYITNNNIAYYSSDGTYSPSILTRMLKGWNPVVITWGWLDNYNHRVGGHAVTIYGYYYDSNGTLILRIKDPWAPGIGSTYTMSYANVKRMNYDRVWEAVNVPARDVYNQTN